MVLAGPSHQEPGTRRMIGGLAARPSVGRSKPRSDAFGRKPNALGLITADLYGFRGPPTLARKTSISSSSSSRCVCFNCPLRPLCPPSCARNAPPPLCRLCRPSVPAVPPAVPTVPPAVPTVPPVAPAVPRRCAGCAAPLCRLCRLPAPVN